MKIGNSIAAALVLLFVAHSTHALDPNQPFSSYIRTRFSIENGLPSEIVSNIVQSRDGLLWVHLATGNVARFDGQRFTMFPVFSVTAMALDPDGDLWLANAAEKSLVRISAATLSQLGPLEAITYPIGLVTHTLRFSRSGVLWVGTSRGLYRYEHGVRSSVIQNLGIQKIEESANGDLLLTTTKGFVVWDGSRAVPHPELATQLGVKTEDIFHVFEDSRGVTWICTRSGVARRSGNSIEKLQPWGPKSLEVFNAYEDPQGNIWIAGSKGLFRASTAGLERAIQDMNVRWVSGDRDGNLWVGSNGDGLFRFRNRAVRMFTPADGLPGNVPMAVLTSHDGLLWIGFNCGGLVRFDGHSFRTYDEKDGLLNSCVWSLAEDANHDLWIGTYGGGVFRFRNGNFTQYSQPQGLRNNEVTSVIGVRDGSVWLGTSDGLSHLRNGQIRNYTVKDGLSHNFAAKLYEDRAGGIWIGGLGTIDRLEGDRVVQVAAGLEDFALPVGESSSGAMYVVVASKGMFRIDNGRLLEATPEENTHMIETRQGDLWLIGDGLQRVAPGRFEQARGHDEPLDFTTFGMADGMNSIQTSGGYPVADLTRDGKLWVATVQGLAMLDLPHLPVTDRKPVLYMKELSVGRNQQFPGRQLELPAGTSHVELHFDAVEITSPEKIRMQYRLDGVDSEWLDVKPPGRAVYSTIPPGAHAFHVRACNRDGIWDRTGMVYLIIQKPFFYQTTWFRLAVIATALLLVVALYRLRLRQATARLNARFDVRLAERTRIARELHDTLLQTIHGSKLVADHALGKPGDVGQLLGTIRRLSDWLGQATQEGRAALNSLRPSTIETNDLAAGLRRATAECLLNNSMTVQFSVTGSTREMHPIARDEIYRIGYEAIRNVCEHSAASRLEIFLSYARDLTLCVKDNGVGINPTVLTEGKSGHFGLQGMRERAARIGSKLTLVSSPGSGTELTLVVPGGVIFRSSSTTRFQKIKTFLLRRTKTSD